MHNGVMDDGTPVSFAQRRLWFAQQLDPGSADYLLPLAVRLSGELDTGALVASLTGIVDRHEVLRTRFAAVDGEPRPLLEPPGRARVHRTRARDAAELFDRELSRPMDLAAAPPVRMTLARLDSGEHLLLVVVHHIAVDGRSWDVLLDELAAGYRGERVAAPETRYADFARRQRERLTGPRRERLLQHWRTRLAGLAPLDLPTDRPRPAFWDGAGDVVRFTVPAELVAKADEAAKTHRVTRYMLLLAVYQALLAHYSGRDDIAVCTTLSDRTRPGLAGLIGPFVNTVVQRTDLGGRPAFPELLGRVRDTVLSGLSAAEAPFEQVVGAVSTERDLSRHPLAQASFTLVNTALAPIRLPGLAAELVPPPLVGAPMDVFLDLNLRPDGGLAARLQYATTLFDPATMRRFSDGYRELLAAVLAAPATPVADLAAELGPLRDAAPDSVAVQGDPAATAIVDAGREFTYAELGTMVDGLAGALHARGVIRGDAVAVSAGRGVWPVAAMLAIWRAGGVYVPLDSALPLERKRFMVSEVDVKYVVADAGAAGLGVPVVPITETGPSAPPVRPHPNDLAYVIFTSGSSGRPKAVGVEHHALAAHVTAAREHFGFTAADRVLAFSSFSFDASLDQLLPALSTGAAVVVRPDEQWLPSRLPAIVRDHGLTVLNLPPTYWSELAFGLTDATAPALRSLRLLILGGETVPPAALAAWRRHAPWVRAGNAYGPTETVVTATVHDVSTVDETVPIGRPLGRRRTYVVDDQDRLAPTGELLIGGPELARGYLGRPARTAERFVPDGFGGTGGRLYRTGDLVRRRPDGELEFLGRVDDQVKVRGFRIELGEVDAALARCTGVRAAAAAVRRDAQGGHTLTGYVVGETEGVRAECGRWLPAYAVPTEIVALDALPVNAAGKLDRAALPDAHQHRLEPDAGFTAPRDETERAIAAIWSEVLGVGPIGLDDSFFDLGGHSLLATMAVSRVAERLGRDVELRTLFEHPRLRDFGPKVAAARVAGGAGIVPVDRRGPLPMSFAQERLWFLDRMSELGEDYVLWFSWRVSGPLDRTAWQRALDDVVARHEVLRTALAEVDGRPVQLVRDPVAVPLHWTDAETDAETVRAEATAFATARFDLAEPPLLRAGVWRLGPGDHVVVLAFHHVATDGWSKDIVFAELAEAYAGREVGEPTVQYGDYAVWQRDRDTSGQLEYWRGALADMSALDLPTDRPRPAVRSGRGAAVRASWPTPAGFDELAARCGATRFMVLLAVFQVVLGRWAGRTDIPVGTPVAGRGRTELERLVGFFVNTVVLRGDLGGDPAFSAFLDRVRHGVLGAFDHQDVPFEHLVQELRPDRDLSRNPLFQVMFDLAESAASPAPAVDGLGFAPFTLPWRSAKFDLTANVVLHPGRIDLDLEYSTDLFDEATAHRFAGWMHRTLVAVSADPDVRIGDVDLLSTAERAGLLTWAGTGRTGPDPFLVAGAPDDVALVCGGQTLRYGELDEQAGRLAAALVADGVRPGTAVGVRLGRGVRSVVAMLAVWRAGGVYVPLDPRFPARRLEFMIAEAGVERIIDDTDCTHGTQVPGDPIGPRTPDPRETAYVIFTSGSSGRPKAVAVPHGALAAHVAAARECFGITAADRVLSFASLSFDASFEQILPALGAGARVVLRPDDVWSVPELAGHVRAEGVTVLELTPSYLTEVTAGPVDLGGLRLLVTGGEVLPSATLGRWFEQHPGVPVVNTYGPTESVISTTAHRLTAPGPARVPIGGPLGGRRLYVVDAHGALAPTGVPGELLVGGAELAHGYLGRPGATAEKFVPDGFGGTGGRLYRTGDLVRWRPDATLEFLGRVDDQVQIRGFRVEPGEVEAVLREHPAVADAAVVVRDVRGEPALVAYVVGDGDLRAWCASRLPGYLVPPVFVALESLPRTVPGKVDVAALPAPDVPVATAFEAPDSPTETVTAQVWAEVLGVARVGRHEDFFALGGHSLRAVAVAARLRAAFGCPVQVRDLFEHPTVARLAARVEDRLVAEIAAMSDDEIDLSLTVDHRN